MQERGTPRGYFPETTNSILVVSPRNVPRAEEFFRGVGGVIVTGSRYLWGFFGDGAAEDSWLADKVQIWADSVKTLAGLARKYPQLAYVVLQRSLQQEWAFVQWVAPGIGDAFGLAEEALRKTFLTVLFRGLVEGAPGRGVTRLPVKQAGMALPDPTLTAPENWTASCVITGHLVAELRG